MMNLYHIVYGNMQKRTVYYKERPLDDYHFYNGKILDKVRVVQYPSYFEGGTNLTLTYDYFSHDKLIPATERTDGISFKKDLKVFVKKDIKDGIFFDNFYNLITCLKGYLFLNVTCLDANSESYKKSESFILCDENPIQVLIPPFYGFAFQALEDSIILDKLAYKSEETFVQKTLDINSIKIDWP
jgi:hypothetical protein